MKKEVKKILVLGPPGSGKGTQAEVLAADFDIPRISTGEIFRDNIIRKTKLGQKVKKFIDLGKLVPDSLTNQLMVKKLKEKDCLSGFILDGYPRNLSQAKFLEKINSLNYVLEIWISDKEALERITGRLSCQCGMVYHIKYNPPKKKGICDVCGRELFVRDDDKPQSVKLRLKVYHLLTEPLVSFYREKGILIKVNGEPSISEVTKEIFKKLKGKNFEK